VNPTAGQGKAPARQERVNPPLEERKAPTRAAVASRSGLQLHARRACRWAPMSSRWSGPANLPPHRRRQRLRDPPHSAHQRSTVAETPWQAGLGCASTDAGACLGGPLPRPSPGKLRRERGELRPGVDCLPVHAAAAPSPRPSPPLRRGKGEFDRAPAGAACVQVKPRTGHASGLCRGFPLFQPRVHPLLALAPGSRPSLPPLAHAPAPRPRSPASPGPERPHQ